MQGGQDREESVLDLHSVRTEGSPRIIEPSPQILGRTRVSITRQQVYPQSVNTRSVYAQFSQPKTMRRGSSKRRVRVMV